MADAAADQLILEGIVTTLNPDGTPNIAPMGPVVNRALTRIHLRPFQSSTTFANLHRTECGVLHVTDDCLLLARAAIGQLTSLPPLSTADKIPGVILADACRWFEFRITAADCTQPRAELQAEIVARGEGRPFFGFNRAKHAVLEAAILATRIHLLPAETLREELQRLSVMVEKTGGTQEHEAFQLVQAYIQQACA